MMRASMKMMIMMRRAVQARNFSSLITSQYWGTRVDVKVILKVSLRDDRAKQKGFKAVSILEGVDSISLDVKDQKLTVIGDIDPVNLVNKLRKLCYAEILSVGPAKEERKKEEPKKEQPKMEKEQAELIKAYRGYNPYVTKDDEVAKLESAYQAYNPYVTED